MQYKNINIPIQNNKCQHKDIYFSTKLFATLEKYFFQQKIICFSTKKYTSITKYLFQSKRKRTKTKVSQSNRSRSKRSEIELREDKSVDIMSTLPSNFCGNCD